MTTDTAQVTPQAADASTSQTPAAPAVAATADTPAPAQTALSKDIPAAGTTPAADDKNQPSDANNKDGSDAKDGQADQDKDKGKTEGAPESYADFTLPENMEINSVVMDEFKGMAKEANLPQEQAQKFVETGAKLVQEAVENVFNGQVEAYAKKVDSWHQTRAQDPEIGGTEEKQKETLSQASKVVRAIGGESLLKAMDETGAGNHPEIIRAFYRIRNVIGEDGKLIQGNSGGSDPKTPAQALYPTLPTTQT